MRLTEYLVKDYIIYCDLDDVLVDFLRGVQETVDPSVSTNKGFSKLRDIVWSRIDKIGASWWADLPWKRDGKQLWNYIKKYKPIILTARPSTQDFAVKGKKEWVGRELGPEFAKTAIVTLGIKKQNWADPNSILIDDRDRNINQWRSRGGIGVLHTKTSDTIKQLKGLGL